jgi:hypothetical protein
MKKILLTSLTTPELVVRFADLALGQFKAELYGEISKYNRLYRQIVAIENELKIRSSV